MKKILLLTLALLLSPLAGLAETSFKLDVMPIFMRAGCNSGSCHGAAAGKDGFMLSLFGYDPDGDYYRLVEEYIGRRINLANPEKSLLLEKAVGAVQHSGGDLFTTESAYYHTILNWLKEGASFDAENTVEAVRIELVPKTFLFDDGSSEKQAKVIAHYSDGSQQDVSSLALYLSNNSSVADIDNHATILAGQPGGTHVFARFDKFTVGAEVTVLPANSTFAWNNPPAGNYIDELIYENLQKLQILPSEVCNDEQFLRRVYLDLTGIQPTPAEYAAFMAAPDRSKLVDELLARDSYAHLWTQKWGEILRLRGDTNPGSGTAMKAAWNYHEWLLKQFRENAPLNQLAANLITGNGSNFRQPASNYYNMLAQGHIMPGKLGEDTAQLFLGVRTQCAMCHNHPFDRWTMDDYYSWTTFFTGVQRKHGQEAREYYVYYDRNAKAAEHLLDKRPMPAKFLGGEMPDVENKDRRKVLAEWLTAPDNEQFRRNLANRIWAHLMGRGIVEPVDDFRISNPASNQQLLDTLGAKLAEYGFDQKKLIRDICASHAYQRSSTVNASNLNDRSQFSRAAVRRVRADVLLDMIARAMETPGRFRRHSATRATELFEGGLKENYNMYFLETFGQSKRETVCAADDNTEANLSQALHLINGETIQRKLDRECQIVREHVKQGSSPEQIIDELYVRTLTRKPSETELTDMLALKPDTTHTRELEKFYHSVYWALLNAPEFMFNH